jgi:polyisoprenoid-binding protein YceI
MARKLALGLVFVALPMTAAAAPESYTVDPYHTFPYFLVSHLGYANLWGRFDKTTGKIVIDPAAKMGTVELAVETASVTTGDNDRGARPRTRDEHLRMPDFFNATEFPRMTFKGNATKWNGDAPLAIEGQITLLGVTRPLNLVVENWKCAPDPAKRHRCGGNASGQIKRSDFGMKFGVPAVGDELKLYVAVEALKD